MAGRPNSGRRAYTLLGPALLIFLALVFAASAAPALAKGAAPKAEGRVIVKYRLSVPMAAARSAAADMNAQVVGRVRTFGLNATGRYVVVSSDSLSTGELIGKYKGDPAVEYVEPDYVIKAAAAVTPNDPLFANLWGLSQISAPLAWGTSTGSSGVVVADIDTGVDYTHPDLAANMWDNPGETAGNGIDDDGNGYVDDVHGINAITASGDPADDNGHGTLTAGIMAAVGDNGTGVAGVCWSAQVMALKFMSSAGSGYTSDAVTCINYMTWEKVHYGVDVVAANCSWGQAGGYDQTLHDAIAAAGNAGIVCVCAAGNNGTDNDTTPFYPAAYDCPNIITVAATDSSDSLASFSNWGPTTVDLAAPGVDILSTIPTALDSAGYESENGTSLAAPYVTGAVALMAAAYPDESMATRISEIESSVDPVDGLAGKVASGGRLDLANALYRGTPFAITGLAPASGPVGTIVTLTGTDFSGATSVRFHGTAALAFSVDSDTQITATVPGGATSGRVSVTTPIGTATSATSFTVTAPAHSITGFRPASGAVGSSVTISGTGFTNVTAVSFNGTPATTFSVDSDSEITATVPSSDASGPITVTAPEGSATSSLSFICTGVDDWFWQNPLPQAMSFSSVCFADVDHGWSVGAAGLILATTDGGGHWVTQDSGITDHLNSVDFADADHGWAVGAAGTVVATTDGGATWVAQASGITAAATLESVAFADDSDGWAAGFEGFDGLIYATTDGGAHWTLQSAGATQDLESIDCADADHGWAVGYNGAILATTDGGANWALQASGTTDALKSVDFVDAAHGWAVGWGSGAIVATTDGGAHWTNQTAPGTANHLYSVHFTDATHGWAADSNADGSIAGEVLATTDGGANWTVQQSHVLDGLSSVTFADPDRGWAVNESGTILATTDAGADWSSQTPTAGTEDDLNSVFFADAQRGWAVGGSYGGAILATSDGGAHWAAQTASGNSFGSLSSVTFTDAQHGWAVGSIGAIVATSDGGATWNVQNNNGDMDLLGVAFSDSLHGWAVGSNYHPGMRVYTSLILATTDGGAHWAAQAAGNATTELNAVAFPDATHGWAVGFQGAILATTDGGAHWTPQTSGSSDLNSVAFTDDTHGWAVGFNGAIIATTDGGAHWTPQSSGTTDTLESVSFADPTHGWAVSLYDGSGLIATTDGGTHWTPEPIRAPMLWGVHFVDDHHGWAVGNGGAILAFSDATADDTPPSTTCDAVGLYAGPATITLDPRDNAGGSGVASTKWVLSGAENRSGTGTTVSATTLGTYHLEFWSVDAAGNVEAHKTADFTVAPPVSFTPTAGKPDTTVTVTGGGFTGATAVEFNGLAATTFTVDSATQITAKVPGGATSGVISITTPAGSVASTATFTVLPGPWLALLMPDSGPPGTSVTLLGGGLTGATAVTFNGTAASFTVDNPAQITATVPAGATSGPVSVTTPLGTATGATSFMVDMGFRLALLMPDSGPVGTSVTLLGGDLTGATAVTFNGTAASFTIDNAAEIDATVPAGATSGPVSVTTPLGTATSATDFTVIGAPTVTGFTPTSGPVGTSVALTGTDFSGATAVKFNGTGASFTEGSDAQITAIVPASATSGTITITTPGGTAASQTRFTVVPPRAAIIRVSPTSGRRGASVTIIGANFGSRRSVFYVKFGGFKCTRYISWSSTRIRCLVPAKARLGKCKVTVSTGSGTSNVKTFTVRR